MILNDVDGTCINVTAVEICGCDNEKYIPGLFRAVKTKFKIWLGFKSGADYELRYASEVVREEDFCRITAEIRGLE